MPEWLLTDENYIPRMDKDTFINKSILSLLGLLSRIRAQSGNRTERFGINAVPEAGFHNFPYNSAFHFKELCICYCRNSIPAVRTEHAAGGGNNQDTQDKPYRGCFYACYSSSRSALGKLL